MGFDYIGFVCLFADFSESSHDANFALFFRIDLIGWLECLALLFIFNGRFIYGKKKSEIRPLKREVNER
jgi:hypothetical protein